MKNGALTLPERIAAAARGRRLAGIPAPAPQSLAPERPGEFEPRAAYPWRNATPEPEEVPAGAAGWEVGDLLDLHGEEFIEPCYAAALGRAPEESERRRQTGRLSGGVPKSIILASLRYSGEGIRRAAPIRGLIRQLATGVFRILARKTDGLRRRLFPPEGPRPDTMREAGLEDLAAFREPELPPLRAGGEIYFWVDHTASFDINTGTQRVTRALGRALVDAGLPVVFVCWDARRKALRTATRAELQGLARHNGPSLRNQGKPGAAIPPDRLSGRWLVIPEVTHIVGKRQDPTASIHDYCAANGLRSAWVFYDAIPLRDRQFEYLASDHRRYMRSLLRAQRVFPISEYSAQELLEVWGRDAGPHAEKVRPIALAGEFPGRARVMRYEDGDGSAIRILSVGSVTTRKNQLRLLLAFQRLRSQNPGLDVSLTLVGNCHSALQGTLDRMMEDAAKVKVLGFVDDAALSELYRDAHFTVFPSLLEGFGLPILESLWHGKPCLTAGFGAMEEVARGGGCLATDTHFTSSLADAMRELATDAFLRRDLGEQAVRRPIKSWDQYARELAGELGVMPANAPVRIPAAL